MIVLSRTPTSKECKFCNQIKPAEKFYREPRNKDGLMGKCKDCTDLRTKQWQQQNPHKVRQYNIKSKYSISETKYGELFAAQKGKCAICFSTDPGSRKSNFCVDHCHRTGIVRGLLCDNCNIAIGKFNDDIKRIERSIEYLETTKSTDARDGCTGSAVQNQHFAKT